MQGRRTSDAMQPLAFAILRTLTPPDVEVVVYDERVETIPLDEPTDLVAMTVETYTARRAFQLATAYRRRGVPVVMGGYHPTFVPGECGAFADPIASWFSSSMITSSSTCQRRGSYSRRCARSASTGSVNRRSTSPEIEDLFASWPGAVARARSSGSSR